jgi:two-component system sensor histidine kinase/response regulator
VEICVTSKEQEIKLMDATEKIPRILIIDDEEVVLDSCRLILRNENYKISTVSNGELGLQLLPEFKPDLVFVDLKMPGLSGFEVLKKISVIDPNIVSIVITGFSTISSAVDAMKNGAYDFLPKPFTPDEFRLITSRGLDRRKLVLETISLKREKEMLKEHFAAVVSHELKSPLASVQQNLYLLEAELADKLDNDQKAHIERMKTKITDLINLIHTWLRVISVDVNKLRDNFQQISIENVISKATENVQQHAIRKDISIINSLISSPSLIIGDEGTLVEAIGNLLGNAIKFSRVSSQIQIKTETIEGFLVISISDNGVGIAKEDLPYIFEDFFTGDTGQIVEKSSGLGLAITRRIIEAHHGTIMARSEFGQGSTFTINLPVIPT